MTYSITGKTECGTPIHVLMSSGNYIAQVRRIGCQKYETVGKAKTLERAIARAASAFKGNHRIRVLFEDSNPYYEPRVAFEGIRK